MHRIRKPTMKHVASAASVSLGTVSKVLNNDRTVASDRRSRVIAACESLSYAHNFVAASLKRRSTRTIGLVVPDIRNTFFAEVVEALEATTFAAGYSLITVMCAEDRSRALEQIRTLIARQVDGIAVIPSLGARIDLQSILGKEFPCVLIDRTEADNDMPTVATDSEEAAYQGTRYLLSVGHRRIVFAANSTLLWNTRERIAGFERAIHEDQAGDCEVAMVGVTIEEIRASTARLLKSGRFTALFTCCNPVTLGALKAIQEIGVNIPNELSLLAFDDFDWLTLVRPFVSAIRQPAGEIGREAWRLLSQQIAGGKIANRHVRFSADLVVRQSTCPPFVGEREDERQEKEAKEQRALADRER
jgi:LacI family transcriptional regulator